MTNYMSNNGNSKLVDYAKKELALMGHSDDEMQAMINHDILEVVKTFSNQGHSGFSASYALNILERLLDYKPIKPLTGEDSEWDAPFDKDGNMQNKRCSSVFKNVKTGDSYDVDALGVSYGNKDSCWYSIGLRFYVDFPYYPRSKPYIIDLPKSYKNKSNNDIINYIRSHQSDDKNSTFNLISPHLKLEKE